MSHHEAESELIAKAKQGDRAAVGMLLLDYNDELIRFIHRKSSEFVLQRVGVDEILSQVRLSVFRGIQGFEGRGEGAFGAWLRQVTHNRIVDAYRRETRRREVQAPRHAPFREGEESLVDLFEQWAADTGTASAAIRRAEKIQSVRSAISGLAHEKYRVAMELKHLEQRSNDEIAEHMGCTPQAVRGYLDRGKKELLAALGRESQYFSQG